MRTPRSWMGGGIVAVILATGCAASPFDRVASRFRYRVPFEIGYTQFVEGNCLEVTELWGTRPTIEVGGDYLVVGRCRLESSDRGRVTFYETAEHSIGPDTDLLNGEVNRGNGGFALVHSMPEPGWFHISLYRLDGVEPTRLANVYFGCGESLRREAP
ncbi:MAG: hypothetical protein HYR85_12065 [Planctomycetes bacterium]|nr:hypothetical protein [Planctomycetota bacterium]MBI3844399.1 hypothetical protein [Planctomycetota bacterium]